MGKTYAEIVNEKRSFEKQIFEYLVRRFAKKGYLLIELGENKYDRYSFTNMVLYDDKTLLSTNYAKNLEQLEKILKLLKLNARTLPYETKLIELIYHEASDEEYLDLMTDMEEYFNIPLLDNPEWNERNKDVVSLYRAIGNQRRFEEELEEDWELDP